MRALATVMVLAAGAAAAAQDPIAMSVAAIEEIDAAAERLAEAEAAQDRVAALTRAVRAYEAALAVLRDSGRRITLERDAARASFERDSSQVSRMVAALQSAGAPTTAVRLLHPAGPLGSVRAAILLADVVPALETGAETTGLRLRELGALEDAVAAAAAALARGAEGARSARLALAAALERRDGSVGDAAAAAVAAQLNSAALGLEEVMLRLAETPLAEDLASRGGFDRSAGDLPLPVQGVVLRGFDPGAGHPGVSLATRPGALVSFAAPSTVRFAGRIAPFGRILILEPAPSLALVLTGLHETFVRAGEVLPPGAPLGLMGGTEETAAASQFDRGRVLTETLYVEARADGDVIDPATWFALDEEK